MNVPLSLVRLFINDSIIRLFNVYVTLSFDLNFQDYFTYLKQKQVRNWNATIYIICLRRKAYSTRWEMREYHTYTGNAYLYGILICDSFGFHSVVWFIGGVTLPHWIQRGKFAFANAGVTEMKWKNACNRRITSLPAAQMSSAVRVSYVMISHSRTCLLPCLNVISKLTWDKLRLHLCDYILKQTIFIICSITWEVLDVIFVIINQIIIIIMIIILYNLLLDIVIYSSFLFIYLKIILSLCIYIPIFFYQGWEVSVNFRNCNILILNARILVQKPGGEKHFLFSFSLMSLNDSRIECPL